MTGTLRLLQCSICVGVSSPQSCKAWSLSSKACPSLRCQRYGLVMTGISETLLTKVPKIESRMEDTAESNLQEVVDSK